MPNPNAAVLVKETRDSDLWGRTAAWAMTAAFLLTGLVGILYIAAYTILLTRLPFDVPELCGLILLYTAGLFIWCRKAKFADWRLVCLSVLPAGAVVLLSVWASGHIYDTSFDGQGYHMLAVSSLSAGWNPLYHPDFSGSLWVQYYPKGSWLIEAAIYRLTGHIENGKALNFIVMAAAFYASLGALLKLLAVRGADAAGWRRDGAALVRAVLAILISACAACNPVTLAQLFTDYNDGLIASLLLTLISAAVYYALTSERRALGIAAVTTMLLINVKFTAIAYAGLICFWLIAALMVRYWTKRRESEGKPGQELLRVLKLTPVRRALLVLLCSGLVGIVVLGWNPYVVNTMKDGHPFYPLAGKHPIDIMTLNSPDNFIGKNRLQKFLLSYSSKTEDAATPKTSHRVDLWPIPWEDFRNVNVDTRVAGFGPLSPWILIGSALLCMLTIASRWKAGVVSMLLAAALLTTVFINPEPWWARYVPQLWLAPLIIISGAWLSKRRTVQILGLCLLAILLTDAYKSGDFILNEAHQQSVQVKQQLHELAGKQLLVYPEGFTSVMVRLKEQGIKFKQAAKDQPCEKPVKFAYTPAYYCELTGE